MEWYEQWFGEEYLLVYQHRDREEAEREIAAIVGLLGLGNGELVLDLCCGTGRHDFPLAAAGCRVVGLDYSSHLMKEAAAQCVLGDDCPRFVRADARKQVFRDSSFDTVLNLFTSFGYFKDSENRGMIAMIGRILKPGGSFYIDYLNPPKVLEGLVPESERDINGIHIVEQRHHDTASGRLVKDIHLTRQGKTQHFRESVQLYSPREMQAMIENAGLTLTAALGSADGAEYREDSLRMILHGRKS